MKRREFIERVAMFRDGNATYQGESLFNKRN